MMETDMGGLCSNVVDALVCNLHALSVMQSNSRTSDDGALSCLIEQDPKAMGTVARLKGASEGMRMSAALPALAHVQEVVALLVEMSFDLKACLRKLVKALVSDCLVRLAQLLGTAGPQRELALASGIVVAVPALAARLGSDDDFAAAFAQLFSTLHVMEIGSAMRAFEGGFGAAMHALVKLYPGDAGLALVTWMSTSKLLGLDADCARVVRDLGLASSVIGSMKRHPKDEKLQAQGVTLVVRLVRLQRKELLALGANDVVVAALRAHHKSCSVVKSCLFWFAHASRGKNNSWELPAGVHRDAVAALRRFPGPKDVHGPAWVILSGAALRSKAIQEEVRGKGDFEAVLAASLRDHGADHVTARGVCTMVFLLRESHPEFNRLGVGEALLGLFGLHKRNPIILEPCCAAIMVLAGLSDNVRVRFMAAGAAGKIVKAMRQNKKHAGLQASACNCLKRLATSAANRGKIMDLDIVGDVVGALKLHEGGVCMPGVGLLTNLAARKPDNQRVLLRSGAVQYVIALMRKHPEHLLLQQNSCGLIANVARRDQAKLMADGAGDAIIAAMHAFPAETRLLAIACGAIANLSASNEVNLAKFEALGVNKAFGDALRKGNYKMATLHSN